MYEMFEKIIIQLKLPAPVREYQFAPPRKWRIDFAWPKYKLAIEVEGGIFMRKNGIRGGHVRGSGYKGNMHKYNEIEMRGYTLLRFMPEELMGYGIDM
ncbi:unnamed protein product, partial [marine sediment metagenome]